MSTVTSTDAIYTEVPGTTCYIGGSRGTVTAIERKMQRTTGAFVQIDESKAMLYVDLGASVGDRGHAHEVLFSREISRDDFDRMTCISELRTELGWRS